MANLKTNKSFMFAILLSIIVVPNCILSQEQDTQRNVERLVRQLGKVSPSHKRFVQDLLEDGEADEEIIEICTEFLAEYNEIKSESGLRLARAWTKLAEAELEMERLFWESEESGVDEASLKRRLSELIDAEIKFESVEIDLIDDEAQKRELRAELEERRESKEEELEEALGEVMRELNGEEADWDEGEDGELLKELESDYLPIQPVKLTDNEVAAAGKWDFESRVLSVLREACYDCHGDGSNDGNLDMEFLLGQLPLVKNRERWQHVIAQIENRTMPPPDTNHVSDENRKVLAAWFRDQLENFDYASIRNPGYESAKRLTHEEYNNTVRDLIGIDLRPADRLPTDLSTNRGFDNSANSLFLNDGLLERYLGLAEDVVDAAFPLKDRNADQDRAWQRLFGKSATSDDEPAAAKEIFQRYLPRAYRTTVTEDDVAKMVERFERYRNQMTFSEAILKCVEASLVSPRFLLRVEEDRSNDGNFKIDEFALANRLSYFLWASMPDDRLFQLAKTGNLSNSETLRSEVKRMIRDPKADSLGSSFAGQWLGFEHLGSRIRLDPIDNPWCTDSLMNAMRSETGMFFVSLIRDDRPIRELIDSEYTYVNEELAKFYRMKNVRGKQMQRVPLESKRRGGIFGQASILAVTSFPDRTSPVTRGAWVLTNVLGQRPPNPPPNASQLNERIESLESLTQRQKMEVHRRNPNCAACHDQIDPLGFALENYDLFGRYRTRSEEGRKIDPRATLPDGTTVDGIAGLKNYVADQKLNDVLTQLTRKMLAYALGRQLEYYDEAAVQRIVSRVIADDWKMQTMVLEIVKSYPFQFKQIQPSEVLNHVGGEQKPEVIR